MRVAFISEYYPPHYKGGYELHCAAAVNDLVRRGHHCVVITSRHGVDRPCSGLNIHRFMHTMRPDMGTQLYRRVAQLQNAWLGRRNYQVVKKVLEEVKPDLVYVWRVGAVSIFPVHAAHDERIPIVYQLGDYWLLEMKRDFVLEESRSKKIYRNALMGGTGFTQLDFSNIITVSEALKRRYVEHGFKDEDIEVIPCSIPDELVFGGKEAPPAGKNDVFKLFWAGRLVEEKGAHVAVLALSHLINALNIGNIHLDIVGSGPEHYRQRLEMLIAQHHLQRHVALKKAVPHRELLEMYREHHAFLFTSTWEEPFGLTIVEAMAKGVPVIASRVGAASEIVADGVNGIAFSPHDSIELAQAITTLMSDTSLAAKFRVAGLCTVREKYLQRHVHDRLEQYLLDKAEKGCSR